MVYILHYILTLIIVCTGLSDINFQYAFYKVIKGEKIATSNLSVYGVSKLKCSVLCTSRNDCCMAAYDTVNLVCHVDVSGSCCMNTTSAVGWQVMAKEKFGCECGWLQHETNCYYVPTDKMTWSAAQSFCATRGSQLLTIHDDEENNWICSTVGELSYVSGTYLWTAGIRDPGGDIVWQDTNGAHSYISYSNWSPGEPIGPAGVADCVGVYMSSDKWDDIRCSGTHIVVCKKVKS